ncbi:hypothetical protein ASC68_17975 [Devosia sp. Root105]|nr:hypothetical protein ASC68_17975 [Devosia sp. Root105]
MSVVPAFAPRKGPAGVVGKRHLPHWALGAVIAEMDREPRDRWWLYATVFLAIVTGTTAGLVAMMIWARL